MSNRADQLAGARGTIGMALADVKSATLLNGTLFAALSAATQKAPLSASDANLKMSAALSSKPMALH